MTMTINDMRAVQPGYYNVRFGEAEYTDWMDESMSWKQTCYIGDWSFLWQRWFRGLVRVRPGRWRRWQCGFRWHRR